MNPAAPDPAKPSGAADLRGPAPSPGPARPSQPFGPPGSSGAGEPAGSPGLLESPGLLGRASRNDIVARVMFGLGVIVQLVVLYAPRAPSTGGLPIDKVVHATIFGGVLWLGARARVPVLPLTVVLCLHTVISELVQNYLLAHRDGDPLDVLADLTGVLIVTLLLRRQKAAAVAPG